MIYIGAPDSAKRSLLSAYAQATGIRHIVVIAPKRFQFQVDGATQIQYEEAHYYRHYYRLLQEVDAKTLIVLNECLRTQGRHHLIYNCIRNYLNQTPHQLIFQHLPLIDTIDDFMILFDLDTRSRWKRERFRHELLREAHIQVDVAPVEIRPIHVSVDDKLRAAYAKEKAALLAEVREDPDKDPHMIPRNLLLVSGKAKLQHVDNGRRYVGRNNRLKLSNLETYRDVNGHGERIVFELPHNFIDFCDFLAVSRQNVVDVLVADTKTEDWYLRRYQGWAQRVNDATAILRQQ